MEELNDYELARARLIARNRERMVAMGLLGAASSLAAAAKQGASAAAAKKPRPRPRPRAAQPRAPTRASKRLRGEKTDDASTTGGAKDGVGGGSQGGEEEEGEEEERQPPPRWTDEELREIRREQEVRMSERLSDLELSGLIDASPGVAHFAIVGAHHKGQKRKHYKVTLENPRPSKATCECVDFKIRRKKYGGHCKHIKLVLAQLGIGEGAESSDGWEEALERVVMAK